MKNEFRLQESAAWGILKYLQQPWDFEIAANFGFDARHP